MVCARPPIIIIIIMIIVIVIIIIPWEYFTSALANGMGYTFFLILK